MRGRAGRDGNPAKCIVLYKSSDQQCLARITEKGSSKKEKEVQKDELKLLVSYCYDNQTCRHVLFDKALYGQASPKPIPNCTCDNCQYGHIRTDLTEPVLGFLHSIEAESKTVDFSLDDLKIKWAKQWKYLYTRKEPTDTMAESNDWCLAIMEMLIHLNFVKKTFRKTYMRAGNFRKFLEMMKHGLPLDKRKNLFVQKQIYISDSTSDHTESPATEELVTHANALSPSTPSQNSLPCSQTIPMTPSVQRTTTLAFASGQLPLPPQSPHLSNCNETVKRLPEPQFQEFPVKEFHTLFCEAYLKTVEDDELREMERESLSSLEGNIRYTGTLEEINGEFAITLCKPEKHNFRYAREYGSCRIFRLKIPSTLRGGAVQEFRTYFNRKEIKTLEDRFSQLPPLPISNGQEFLLDFAHYILEGNDNAIVYCVRLKSELLSSTSRGLPTGEDLRLWHIPVNNMRNDVANIGLDKYNKRFKLGHSHTTPTVVLSRQDILENAGDVLVKSPLDGVGDEDVIMNDGQGLVELNTFDECCRMLFKAEKLRRDDPMPTALQVRLGPCKGVLLRHSIEKNWLAKGFETKKAILPKSMVKYKMPLKNRKSTQLTIEVNRTNVDWCREPAHLNRDNILLLESRGVALDDLESVIEDWLTSMEKQFLLKKDRTKADLCEIDENILDILRRQSETATEREELDRQYALKLLLAGFSASTVPFLYETFAKRAQRSVEQKLTKFKIPVAKSRRLMMIADPTGTLRPGECYIELTVVDEDTEEPVGVLDGQIVAIREPTYFDGDVVVLKAVKSEALRGYTNVFILPVKTDKEYPTSIATIMSGGDFDGDSAFVSWDKRIVPKKLPWKDRIGRSSVRHSVMKEFVNTGQDQELERVALNRNERLQQMHKTFDHFHGTSQHWLGQLSKRRQLLWDVEGVRTELSYEVGMYCFLAVDRPNKLVLNGKDVEQFLEEIDKYCCDLKTKKQEERVALEMAEGRVALLNPHYDVHRQSLKGPCTYTSESVLAKIDQLCRKRTSSWGNMKAKTFEENREIMAGGKDQLDPTLMSFFDDGVKTLKEKNAAFNIVELEEKLNKIHANYIQAVVKMDHITPYQRLKEWKRLIEREVKQFEECFPDPLERRVAAVDMYRIAEGKKYCNHGHRGSQYVWYVCNKELCDIKATGEGCWQVAVKHVPALLNRRKKAHSSGQKM